MSSPPAQQALECFYDTGEVAERYRTKPGTVRYWRHIGYGPKGVKVGRRVLYPHAEIQRFDSELASQMDVEAAAS